jgi:ribosomal protein S21
MYVEVRGDSRDDLDRAIKAFSKMVKKNDIINEVKKREFFVAPSKKRILKRQESKRRKIRDARKVQKRNDSDW